MKTTMESSRKPKVIAVAAGKGGVGKSFLSANVALTLAGRGSEVLAVDLDLGGANLHTVLGVKTQGKTLSDFVKGRKELKDLVCETRFENLSLISGAHDDVFSANPSHKQKKRLLSHLSKLESDYILLDLGAGSTLNTLDFFLLAEHQMLVVLPEPTSIENAYRFLKAAFIRKLATVGRELGADSVVETARSRRKELGIRTPADLLRAIAERDPERGPAVFAQMARFSPFLILNQSRVDSRFDDRQVAQDMVSASKRFFGINLRLLGCIPIDDNVRISVRERTPVIVSSPNSFASDAVRRIVDQMMRFDDAEERAA